MVHGTLSISCIMKGGYLTLKSHLEAIEILPPFIQYGPHDGCNLQVQKSYFYTPEYRRLRTLTNFFKAQLDWERYLNTLDKSAANVIKDLISGEYEKDLLPPFKPLNKKTIGPSHRHTSREHEQKQKRQQQVQQNRLLKPPENIHIRFETNIK